MRSETLVKIINWLLLLIVVGTPLFYLRTTVYPYITAKSFFFYALVEILFALWVALAIFDSRYRPKKSWILIALLVFLGALLLTSFTGEDLWRSFWSTQERMIGVFGFLHFGALALVVASMGRELHWKKIWIASIGTAVVISIIAFIQLKIPNILLNEPIGQRPGATFGNPTFFAGYLLFNIFLTAYLFLSRESNERRPAWYKWIFGSALVIQVAALFLTQTRGDILGLAAGLFVVTALFALCTPPAHFPLLFRSRRFYAGALAAILLFGGLFWMTRKNVLWGSIPGLRRFADISLEDEGLFPRLHAGKVAWEGFLERPFVGWGWENFNIPFNAKYDPMLLSLSYQETRFDKPHNLFLEYLVTGGMVLFLAFLFLIGVFAWRVFRDRDALRRAMVLGAFAAYLVRSAFVFDTMGPLLMLFLFIGWVASDTWNEKIRTEHNPPLHRTVPFVAFGISLCAGLALVYVVNVQSLFATRNQFFGFTNFVRQRHATATKNFEYAIALWSPWRWNFARDYAAATAEAYFYGKDCKTSSGAPCVPDEVVRRAIEKAEQASREHPVDAYGHYMLVDLYNQTSEVSPEEYPKRAEAEAKKALELSPNRQQVYFSLAKTKLIQGKKAEALALVEQGLALNPEVPDAHFYVGVILLDQEEWKRGYEEVQEALRLGRRWKNGSEARVVGNMFANGGYLSDAILLYEKSLELESGDPETLYQLGAAYYFAKRRDEAKKIFFELIEKVDVVKSPAYSEMKPILDALGIVP